MRTTLAALTTLVLLTITTAAEDAKSKFFTSSDAVGTKRGETFLWISEFRNASHSTSR